MAYSNQLQATDCREEPTWTGRWFSHRGHQWWRVWACPDHLDGLGAAEFGSRRYVDQGASARAGALANLVVTTFEGGLVVSRAARSSAPFWSTIDALIDLLDGDSEFSRAGKT